MANRVVVVIYSDTHLPSENLKRMFPEQAVKEVVEELLKRTDISGVISVCVKKDWSQISDLRFVSLYSGKRVSAYLRANERTFTCDISSCQISSKTLYLKLRVAGDELNERWRAKWEANGPAREIESCRRKITSLLRLRQVHKKRISKEQRIVAQIEHQIAERKQRIKDLGTA